MDFPRSRVAAAAFEFLDEAPSTNDELVERAVGPDAASWPDLSVIVTDNQTMGRGRLGRTWLAPTGKALAVSILVRPRLDDGDPLPPAAIGWLPLLAGAAMTRAVRASVAPFVDRLAARAAEDGQPGEVVVDLKWPNDVLISGYKVCGVLAELLPDGAGAVIGAGLNLSLDEHDLPTLSSTSLLLVTGERPDADAILADYLEAFSELYRALLAAGGDPDESGLRAEVSALCGSLGRRVRVELPGDRQLLGIARSIDVDGRLVVENLENGELQAVAAGDVTHLRY